MIVTGIECPSCKELVWSRHRHDMRYCKCGEVAADGGRDYLRVCFTSKEPRHVRINTDTGAEVADPAFAAQREKALAEREAFDALIREQWPDEPTFAEIVAEIGAQVPPEAWESASNAITLNPDGSVTIGSRARLAEMLEAAAQKGLLEYIHENLDTAEKRVSAYERIAAEILRREGL